MWFSGITPSVGDFEGEVCIIDKGGLPFPNPLGIKMYSFIKPTLTSLNPTGATLYNAFSNTSTITLNGSDLTGFVANETSRVMVSGIWIRHSGLNGQPTTLYNYPKYYINTNKFIQPYDIAGARLQISGSGYSFSGGAKAYNVFVPENPWACYINATHDNIYNDFPSSPPTYQSWAGGWPSDWKMWNKVFEGQSFLSGVLCDFKIKNAADTAYSNGIRFMLTHPTNKINTVNGYVDNVNTNLHTETRIVVPQNHYTTLSDSYTDSEIIHWTYADTRFVEFPHKNSNCIATAPNRVFSSYNTSVPDPYNGLFGEQTQLVMNVCTPYTVINANGGKWTYNFNSPITMNYVAIAIQDYFHSIIGGVVGKTLGGRTATITLYDINNNVLKTVSSFGFSPNGWRSWQGFRWISGGTEVNQRFLVSGYNNAWFFGMTTGISKLVITNNNATQPMALAIVAGY